MRLPRWHVDGNIGQATTLSDTPVDGSDLFVWDASRVNNNVLDQDHKIRRAKTTLRCKVVSIN
jgi:hypothetical protein